MKDPTVDTEFDLKKFQEEDIVTLRGKNDYRP